MLEIMLGQLGVDFPVVPLEGNGESVLEFRGGDVTAVVPLLV